MPTGADDVRCSGWTRSGWQGGKTGLFTQSGRRRKVLSFIRPQACPSREGHMRRRDFFATLRGAAAWQFIGALGDSMLAGPSVAQEAERKRRIGVLMAHPASDPEFQQYAAAFRDGLRKSGWIEGRNISFEFRWGALDDSEVRSRSAKELVALRPDLILTQNTPPTASTLQQTRSIPIIFVIVADPIGS